MEHHPPTLAISGLRAGFPGPQGLVPAVDGVDLTVPRGTIVGLVGESGCGKSVTALSVLGLLPPNGQVAGGTIDFGGQDLLTLPPDALRRLRGDRIAMIFQDPMTSLNPVYPVGRQVAEVLRLHRGLDRKAAKARTVDLFHQVGIPDPAARYGAYPRQLSGGLRQRVMIAMAMACEPELLIADEPTTALDATIQARSSGSWGTCAGTTARPSSSSPTTWGWWPSCATTSTSCTPGRSWRPRRPSTSSAPPGTPTPQGCSGPSPPWRGPRSGCTPFQGPCRPQALPTPAAASAPGVTRGRGTAPPIRPPSPTWAGAIWSAATTPAERRQPWQPYWQRENTSPKPSP